MTSDKAGDRDKWCYHGADEPRAALAHPVYPRGRRPRLL